MRKKIKALTLFSGGLDSILVAKILQSQDIRVTGLSFKSLFFDTKKSEEMAKDINIPLKVIDFSDKHLEIVKHPKYGYGKNMNPCIDCHALMLKIAKQVMDKEKFDFISTGEVLGQRPMSQNKNSLDIIEKESGIQGLLLRPLSAKLLSPTIPEQKAWVDREKLFAISGRCRKKQIEMASKLNIKSYPSPSGGCLLTDIEFSKKLKDLFGMHPNFTGNDIKLLKIGRHFWSKHTKIILGRNHNENLRLRKLSRKKDILVELKEIMGPTALVRSYGTKTSKNQGLEKAKDLLLRYSPKSKNKRNLDFKIFRV